MRLLMAGIFCAVLAPICSAVLVWHDISYKAPIKRIAGRIVGFGAPRPDVKIQVLNHPEIRADDSLSWSEQRRRQTLVASMTSSIGKFEFRGIPKGSYVVDFSTSPPGGWNPLSVFVVVDPKGSSDKLCVELGLEATGSGGSVEPCHR
jgi:hypothetical protein